MAYCKIMLLETKYSLAKTVSCSFLHVVVSLKETCNEKNMVYF